MRKMVGQLSGVYFNNEPVNLALVKMNAASIAVLGGICFHGIGDLNAATAAIVSTTMRMFTY